MNHSKKRIFLIFFIQIILSISSVSAAHYIVGEVQNALDSTSANGRIITIWNPNVGIQDNLTDIIGTGGNSGVDNTYFIDCEMLNTSCQIGDTINAKVFDNSQKYVTNTVSVTITGDGYDLMPSLTLNSPPNVSAHVPLNNSNLSSSFVNFFCNSSDLDGNLNNVTIYGNWSNSWHSNETTSISGVNNYTNFNKSLPEGRYIWSCSVYDNLSIMSFGLNSTFTIDLTIPNITYFNTNLTTTFLGTFQTRVYCNTSDSLTGIKNVSIRTTSPIGVNTFYTTQSIVLGEYYSDVTLNSTEYWNISCFSYDYSGNLNTKNISIIADLEILSQNISFSDKLIESAESQIYVNISNKGAVNANNFLVGFYLGTKETGTQIGNNQTISIPSFSNKTVTINWYPEIGYSNIYVYADLNNSILESDETNNYANKTAYVYPWQNFYGNLSVEKVLGISNARNISSWNTTKASGNIFVVDRESTINWFSLTPLGKNTSGQNTSNDFSDVDTLLNMTGLQDSVNKVYTNNTNANYSTDEFLIFRQIIAEVPIAQSINNSNFHTGILWDTTKDTNNQFDTFDKEDIVFITKVNQGALGAYGNYDYEIRVPAKLRNYYNTDGSKVDFYYDLV